MTVARFEARIPVIGAGTWIHPSADVFGDVVIGEGCWIGPGARIRGDYGRILIGSHTSVEDNCVIHARPGEQTTLGHWVTVGHGAIIHNATVRDWAVLGMGSIVSDWAVVGVWAVVGEGAVVKQRGEVPEGRIAVGVPARVLDKEVDPAYKAEWTRFKEIYVDLARRYPAGWQPEAPAGTV
jgi:carbonic anhydrase/acetyltransferase-like protein (isoleucine patch superfamily)